MYLNLSIVGMYMCMLKHFDLFLVRVDSRNFIVVRKLRLLRYMPTFTTRQVLLCEFPIEILNYQNNDTVFIRSELEIDIKNNTVLEPNMVVILSPTVHVPNDVSGSGLYLEHDSLLIGEEGSELLTYFPIGPDHLIVNKS